MSAPIRLSIVLPLVLGGLSGSVIARVLFDRGLVWPSGFWRSQIVCVGAVVLGIATEWMFGRGRSAYVEPFEVTDEDET